MDRKRPDKEPSTPAQPSPKPTEPSQPRPKPLDDPLPPGHIDPPGKKP